MRVLLLGGAGTLSAPAREAFLAAGHDVSVVSRGSRPLPPNPKLRYLTADRRDAASLEAVLAGEKFDFTCDFLAYDGDDVSRLFRVPGFSPGRLVMISTGQVYLVTEGKKPPFREADSAASTLPEPEHDTRAWHNWVYGMGKRAAEETLHAEASARGVPALALRLPVVQGEADGSLRLWAWLERMRDGGPVLLPDGGAQPVRFVYAGDAAAALLRLAEIDDWPAMPALNLAQPADIPLKEFLRLAAGLAGLRPRFVPVTGGELEKAGLADTCAPYWGRWCSRLDPSAAFALGFISRGPEEYMSSVVRAHMENPPASSHPGYARRAEELALAAKMLE